MIEIRKIKPIDLNDVLEITKICFPDSLPESYFKKLLLEYPEFYIAKKNGQTAGYILGFMKTNTLGWIKTIAVSPKFQKQGIGNKMMNFIIDKLEKAGAEKIGLYVRENNQKGISFYLNLGFNEKEKIKKYYSNGDSAYLMEK